MSFEVTGTVTEINEVKQTGNHRVQSFVIQQPGEYGKPLLFNLWNDKIDKLNSVSTGDEITVKFNIDSRLSDKGYWNTNATAYDIK